MTNSGTAATRLGKKIRKVRDLRGYSQEYVASKLNVSTRTYGRIEAGGGVEIDRVEQIARALGVSIDDLLRFDEGIFFENCKQAIYYGRENVYNEASAHLLEQYEARIAQMASEINFLRKQLSQKENPSKA